ncbi:MAG: long-chain-fatty-acid--CoA ligase [Pseudomonadota bacterium]
MTMPSQLPRVIQRNATIAPRAPASSFDGRRRSWGEFAERVARFAGGLRALGLGDGDRVAMLALNSDRYLEYFFAASWAGCVFVPINIRLAPPEFVHWLADSGSRALIVDANFAKVVPQIAPQLPELEHLIYAGDDAAPDGMSLYEELAAHAAIEPSSRRGDDLAALYYTGGTTGASKGVMLSHGAIVHNAMIAAAQFGLHEPKRYLHAAPMFHIADAACGFAACLSGGEHHYLSAFTPASALDVIESAGIQAALMVPTMINMLVSAPEAAGRDLSSLEFLGYGASPMPEAVLKQAMTLMPNVRFTQAYGQTECAPLLTILPSERHVFEGPLAGKAGSVGRPVLNMDVRIIGEDGAELPRGEVGEVCARGPNVMLGYWNRPEQTEEVSRHGWHHTGDGGLMDEDGYIFIVDRMKDMIISGGENVYSAEVENALYKHPDVVECAVIGVPDDAWGERVHAVIRLKEGAAPDEAALATHCDALIAGFKRPRSWEFKSDPLPLSGAGKILKTELRKPWWEGQTKKVH